MNIRAGQGPRVSRQKHAYPPRRHIYKTNDGGNIFAADVHTHIHTLFPGTRARAHTHTLARIRARARARPLLHIDTGCSKCGSLGLALPQACGNSPEACSAVRPLPHAENTVYKPRLPCYFTIGNCHQLRVCIKNPYLDE